MLSAVNAVRCQCCPLSMTSAVNHVRCQSRPLSITSAVNAVNAVNHVNHVNHVKKPCPHHRRALARVLQRRLPASDFWTWLTSLTRLTLLTADVVDIIDGVRVPGDCPRVFGPAFLVNNVKKPCPHHRRSLAFCNAAFRRRISGHG
jgi:hypothetical protein